MIAKKKKGETVTNQKEIREKEQGTRLSGVQLMVRRDNVARSTRDEDIRERRQKREVDREETGPVGGDSSDP